MAERPKLLYIIINDEAEQQQPLAGGAGAVAGGVDQQKQQQQATTRKFPPPRYTRSVLQSTLQLMGCKARHAFKISDRVFEVLRSEGGPAKKVEIWRHHSEAEAFFRVYDETFENERQRGERGAGGGGLPADCTATTTSNDDSNKYDEGSKTPTDSKSGNERATVTVTRDKFLDVVCEALAQYQYVGPNQRADLMLACKVREKKTSVTVLLCGTSGCGKSTLSSLLASRLGITTVVSTDSLRHMMRSFVSEKENPLLWASTYHAGECLDHVAIAEAKLKKKEAKMSNIPIRSSSFDGRSFGPGFAGSSSSGSGGGSSGSSTVAPEGLLQRTGSIEEPAKGNSIGDAHHAGENGNLKTEGVGNASQIGSNDAGGADTVMGSKTLVVQGFKAQSEMVIDSLDRLITAWEQKNESVVVEGVHLSLNFVMGLMKKHPSIVPFMIYISNEGKHLERFAVRAKYMTLDPAKNKYVKYIRNIRTIQEYLCKRADKHLVPKVNNTNVDKSIALIHATIFSCLRRRMGGEPLCDAATNTVKVVDQEYRSQYAASSLGSKGMFQLIQRRGSSRHLMALMNTDGSVAKAWPIESDSNGKAMSGSSNGQESGNRTPLYGPLAIGKSEPVNLQFGNFGLSAWLTDTGAASYATSYNGSGDGHSSRGEFELNSSHPGSSSCSSSPKHGEGGDKELTDEVVVSVSDEEPDEEEPTEADSDGEASDCGLEHIDDDDAGSVDDQSERSDDDGVDYESGNQPDDEFGLDEKLEDRDKVPHHLIRRGTDIGERMHGKRYSHGQRYRGTLVGRLVAGGLSQTIKESSEVRTPENRSHNRSKSCPDWDFCYPIAEGEPKRTWGTQPQADLSSH
ncbi:unnamed protein product [Calypogeia fissa]